MIAGANEVLDNPLFQRLAAHRAPDGGDEGQAGEIAPLLGQVVIDEFLAGTLEAVGALFKGEQRGVSDDDGGVSALEHGVEVGGHGKEWDVGVAPLLKEEARVGDGGAAGGVRGYGMEARKRLAGAAHQQERADAAFGRDGAAGQDGEAGRCGQRGDGQKANVGRAGGQAVRALGGQHPVNPIAGCERVAEGRVLKVPHERSGVKKADGGDAQAGMRMGTHALLEYQLERKIPQRAVGDDSGCLTSSATAVSVSAIRKN